LTSTERHQFLKALDRAHKHYIAGARKEPDYSTQNESIRLRWTIKGDVDDPLPKVSEARPFQLRVHRITAGQALYFQTITHSTARKPETGTQNHQFCARRDSEVSQLPISIHTIDRLLTSPQSIRFEHYQIERCCAWTQAKFRRRWLASPNIALGIITFKRRLHLDYFDQSITFTFPSLSS
jgi:hypothetical protein